MRELCRLEAIRASLVRRGAPSAYIGRLLAELSEHRADLVLELVREGAAADAAEREADRRIGEPAALARAAVEELRRASFVGRHRGLVLVVVPILLLPLIWATVLALAALAAGIFSAGFRVGATSAESRRLLAMACAVCGYVVPALAGAAFFVLARSRFCGVVWCWAPGFMLAVSASLTFVDVFARGTAGRLVVGVVPAPDTVRLLVPLGVLAVFEAWHRTARGLRRGVASGSKSTGEVELITRGN
jgi:hypothetical protein